MSIARDAELQAVMDALCAPGGPLETVPLARFGTEIPVLKHAPASLGDLFAHYCGEYGALEFVVDGAVRLTFAEVHALARRAAAGLIGRHGIKRGDRVGIAARNSANWIVLYFGVLLAGGCATLLNGWWTGAELAEAVDLAGCELVLADGERAARLGEVAHGAQVVTFGHGAPEEGLAGVLGDGDRELPVLGPDDLAALVFTSGSTGKSKAAWSDHRAVVNAALSFAGQALLFATMATRDGVPMPAQAVTLLAVPLFHVTGEVAVLLLSLVIGRKLVVMRRWDAGEALRLIAAEKVTYFLGVPLMSYELASHPERSGHDLSSCLHFAAGGAPRPPAHVAVLRESFPHAFPLLGYGLTETNAVGCGAWNENYLARPASTGIATRPLVELAVLGPDDRALPTGEVGEVAIRSVCNIGGYWRNPEASAALFTGDGFIRTGDLGRVDEDGYLFIVDRAKDIVIRGGENIACIEVEQALYTHPEVAEVAVFGVADERYGEVPVAVWLKRPGSSLDAAGLRAFCAGRLAAYKLPAHWFEADGPLPRTGTEKIDKLTLRARYARGGESDRAGA